MEALLAIDLKDSAMFIAEQNVALLEGKVDRVIGMHAGKLKGEASSSFQPDQAAIRAVAMDIAFVIINAVTVAAIYGLIAIAVSITWSSLGLINLALWLYLFLRRLCRLAGRDADADKPLSDRRHRYRCRGNCRNHRLPARLHPPSRQARLHLARHDRHSGDQPDRQSAVPHDFRADIKITARYIRPMEGEGFRHHADCR